MGSNNSSSENNKINKNYNANANIIKNIKNDTVINNKRKIGETILEAYQRLDREIYFLESLCPGPRLGTVESWLQHLQNEIVNLSLQSLSDIDDNNRIQIMQTQNNNNNDNNIEKNLQNEEIIQLALRLGVLADERKAELEEEFFANLNRSDIKRLTRHFQNEIIAHTQSRMNHLIIIYNKLSELYTEQDGLIASINGGLYLNELEEILDTKLQEQRDIRDKLSSVIEQWRICAFLLKTSLKFAQKAIQIWRNIKNTTMPVNRLNLVLECRNFILASLTTLEFAKLALPQVDIKFITERQIAAIEHVNTYIITDVMNEMRSSHIENVLIVYDDNLKNAISWLFQTFETTLKKDFKDAENKVNEIVHNLRELRLQLFSKIAKNKIYNSTAIK